MALLKPSGFPLLSSAGAQAVGFHLRPVCASCLGRSEGWAVPWLHPQRDDLQIWCQAPGWGRVGASPSLPGCDTGSPLLPHFWQPLPQSYPVMSGVPNWCCFLFLPLCHIILLGGGCSVTKSCLTLFDPMDCSTPGFPVLHYLLEFAQTHVH